ncbi:MAG: DNA alkylation repair protein [Nanoarchaeota archaeon]|nr:DNA alkylation repair protein [Nanoarchaeota archaeon]MBU1051473.1 DNA alkylation repair protein [Nanoarchaeota archaeon]
MSNLTQLKADLRKLSDPQKAKLLQGFFKTGKGQYGEGDIFLGVKVPESRAVAKKYHDLSFEDIKTLLQSKIHEERLTALLLLVHLYQKNPDKKFVDFYLSNTKHINNWDLVDLTAHKIVGHYLENKPRDILYKLARSKILWERRISIISTFHFIRDRDFKDALALADILLNDEHDLMHKAVGWVLREIGKKDLKVEEGFLRKHYKKMPRTMLRYSIEKFPEDVRKKYLKGEFN